VSVQLLKCPLKRTHDGEQWDSVQIYNSEIMVCKCWYYSSSSWGRDLAYALGKASGYYIEEEREVSKLLAAYGSIRELRSLQPIVQTQQTRYYVLRSALAAVPAVARAARQSQVIKNTMANAHVYIMQGCSDVFKIGVSTDPKRRLRDISTLSPVPITLYRTYKLGDNAYSVERRAHAMFNSVRLHGEWFKLEPPALRKAERYLTRAQRWLCDIGEDWSTERKSFDYYRMWRFENGSVR